MSVLTQIEINTGSGKVEADIGAAAGNVSYDNTSGVFSSDNIQDIIDNELMKTDGSNAASNVTFSGKFNTEDDISLANENLLVKSYTTSSGIPLTQISPTLVSFVETPIYFNSFNFTNPITGNLSLYHYVTSSGEVKLLITNPNGISFSGGTSLQPGARYYSNVFPNYSIKDIYYVDMIIPEQSYLAAIVESNQTIDVSLNISGSYNQVSLDVNLQFHIRVSHDYLNIICDSGTYSLYNASSSSIPAATVNQAFIEILASWNDSNYNTLFTFTSEFYGVDSSYENKGVSAFQGYAKGTRSFAFGSGQDTVDIEYGEHSGDTGIIYGTIAGATNQVALGKYNKNKLTTLFEIGNGTNISARSNAFEVHDDGHININGDIYQNENIILKKLVISNRSSLSYTFSDASIKTTSDIDVYTDTYGDNPSSVTIPSDGSCIVTFDEAKVRSVKIHISNS